MTPFKIDFIFDFMPSLNSLSPEIFKRLTEKMRTTINENELIKGIFILSTQETQPFVYSKSLVDFAPITKIAEMINSFNIKYLLKSLSTKGYHGIEVMDFPGYGIAFLKLSDTDILAVLTAEESTPPKNIVKQVLEDIESVFFSEAMGSKLDNLPTPAAKKSNSVPGPKRSEG
jgi:hypothetical protein